MTGWTSPTHLIVILLLALLLFGAKRLPEIGRSLGTGMREFKDSVTGSAAPEEHEQQQQQQQQLPPAEPSATVTSATPSERETV